MEYDKIITCCFLKIMKVKNYLNFVTREYVRVNSYLKRITKINQLDLKHPC